ncbi:RNase P modulator RnpM [Ornithinibacillus contaminans]|uniref:RNase P modulator RnpM n=1 Tax=Ornithinibacillus contaminans TaxID=694055 RepID=UPI00064D8BC3|nr:YlxR family protein [Ornithinibacillus contaminans]
MTGKRKTPARKCVVTNEMKPKNELIRVVRNKEGEVFVDPTGKKNGRGAYLSKDIQVINQAEKTGILNRQLNTQVDTAIYDELRMLVSGHNES